MAFTLNFHKNFHKKLCSFTWYIIGCDLGCKNVLLLGTVVDVVDSSQVYQSWRYFPAEQACSSCRNFILRCWPLTCFRAMLAATLAMQTWNYWNCVDHWSWIWYVAYLDCMKHSCCIQSCNPRDRARHALAGDAWRNKAPFWSLWAGGLSKNEDETNSSAYFFLRNLAAHLV